MEKLVSNNIVVIGAGPAGLAVGALLRQAELPFVMLEKSREVGHAWHYHYERLHLHTVKDLSHLPLLPFPDSYPTYVSRDDFAAYLDRYAEHFDLKPHFGEEVKRIGRDRLGEWVVETGSGRSYHASHVVVATGVNRVPHRPSFPGEDLFEGDITHSVDYRRARDYQGKRTLVVGMGNTGAEIALDLAEHGMQPFLSVRGPVNIVPRDVFGRPTQLTARLLSRLPNWLADGIGKLVQRITVGNLRPFGIKTPSLAPNQQLREEGKTPVIDLGTVEMIRRGRIRVVPGIRKIGKDGVYFEDGSFHALDLIILATGYRPQLPDLIPGIEGTLDEHGCPGEPEGKDLLQGLYFVGFDNYKPGGILGTINRDAPFVVNRICSKLKQNAGQAQS
jgi:cation diffusion facilitator CzcD-associated flavoprotein CzcO